MKLTKRSIMKLKKPKFWDYKKPNFISDLLLPISKLFELFLNFIKRKRIKFEKRNVDFQEKISSLNLYYIYTCDYHT